MPSFAEEVNWFDLQKLYEEVGRQLRLFLLKLFRRHPRPALLVWGERDALNPPASVGKKASNDRSKQLSVGGEPLLQRQVAGDPPSWSHGHLREACGGAALSGKLFSRRWRHAFWASYSCQRTPKCNRQSLPSRPIYCLHLLLVPKRGSGDGEQAWKCPALSFKALYVYNILLYNIV